MNRVSIFMCLTTAFKEYAVAHEPILVETGKHGLQAVDPKAINATYGQGPPLINYPIDH